MPMLAWASRVGHAFIGRRCIESWAGDLDRAVAGVRERLAFAA
ncbi:hypothetical protein ACQP1V_39320 [Microtetraspora malaysiensis]